MRLKLKRSSILFPFIELADRVEEMLRATGRDYHGTTISALNAGDGISPILGERGAILEQVTDHQDDKAPAFQNGA